MFCSGVAGMKRQILRLEVKSALDVNDPDMQMTILAEVSRFSSLITQTSLIMPNYANFWTCIKLGVFWLSDPAEAAETGSDKRHQAGMESSSKRDGFSEERE